MVGYESTLSLERTRENARDTTKKVAERQCTSCAETENRDIQQKQATVVHVIDNALKMRNAGYYLA